MTLYTQVAVLPDTLNVIATCIEDAWAQTRQQVDDVGYHNLIQQTAFAQFLVANVAHQVYQLNDAFPGISASLRPNRTGTAHHVVVNAQGTLITISAVPHNEARPRSAWFREAYGTRQASFQINDESNDFELTPPPTHPPDDWNYIQILHGPTQDNRRELGFILVAVIDRFNSYARPPRNLREFVNFLSEGAERPSIATEVIEENFSLMPGGEYASR